MEGVLPTGSPEGDLTALRALYQATNGENWTHSWDIDGDISTWHGVTMNGEGRVVALPLGYNNLSGAIPPELGNLDALESLDLSNNQLSGPIPRELGNLSALETLNLNWNRLNGSIPPELGDLSELQELRLQYNQLTASIPRELGKLNALKKLDLGKNNLTGSIPKELGRLTALEQLWLSGNSLTGAIPFELGRLTALKRLWVNNNYLTGTIPSELGNLTALKVLHLYNNKLSGSIPPELGNLGELKNLWLQGNRLSGLWDDARLCGEERTHPDAPATSAAGDGMPEQLKAWLDWLGRFDQRLLYGNPWRQPPAAVVAAGIPYVRAYFSDLYAGNVVIHRSLKVVIVGRSGAGKTSLRQSLIARQAKPTRGQEESTVHMDIEQMKIDDLSVRIFDCAGQVAYYGLLQLFITSRALYLLACDLGTLETCSSADNDVQVLVDADKLDELGVGDWLRALTFRLGEADVILVGTQCDRIADRGVTNAERLRAACAKWAQKWRDARIEGGVGSPILIDDTMSLTSCSADGGKQETKTETEWPCDWGTVPETNPPLSLLRRLTHDREGNSPAVEMVLPRSWALAMEILECLALGGNPVETAFEFYSIETEKRDAVPGGSTPKPGYKVMLRDELQKKWQDVINALKLKNILVHNPKGALEGALTIRQHEGTVLRHDSLIFLDVAWLALVLKPLLTHKRVDSLGDIYLPDVGIWLKDERHKISWDRFCGEGVLEPQLAEALWPDDNMAEYVMKTIDAIGLTFPLPDDARHGVVLLLRLPGQRPATVGTALAEFRDNKSAFFVVRWKFHLGVPPGAIEKVITRCCGFGTPSSFWRFGVLVQGEVEGESYAFVLEYLDGNLLLEVFGETGNATSWAALSYTLSVVQNMFVDFPGLPRTASWDCLEHQAPQQHIKMSQEATHVGGHLLSGVCPICNREAGTLGAIAVKLVRMVDVKQSRDDLFKTMQNQFKELPDAWRSNYFLKDYPNEGCTTPANEDAAAQDPVRWYEGDLKVLFGAASSVCVAAFAAFLGVGFKPAVWAPCLVLSIALLFGPLLVSSWRRGWRRCRSSRSQTEPSVAENGRGPWIV